MSITHKQRLVIKVGSALIAPANSGCSEKYLKNIAEFIHRCRINGQQVVLVSSGSVAAGRQWFNTPAPSMAIKKAMAAAGQTSMMAMWDRLINLPVAQILLTHADLCDHERYISIKDTINSLLDNGIIPIVNENDTVTSEELKVGDNDNLAAMTAAAVDADAFIMCTDVDGLYDKNPHKYSDATLLQTIETIDERIYQMAGGAISSTGTGGMLTKIEAAEKATAQGIDTYIVNGFEAHSFHYLLEGQNPGSHFIGYETPMEPSQHWMTHTTKACGEVVIDEDKTHFNDSNEVLTSDDIIAVKGEFSVGDTILLTTDDGTQVAKATANYSSCLLNYIKQEDRSDDSSSAIQPQHHSIISKKHLAVLENA